MDTIKATTIVILVNLIIGNAILYFGGKSTFMGDVNYALMLGMSIACIIVYFLFFRCIDFKTTRNFKLILLSILSCMAIIFLGNFITLLIKEPLTEVLGHIAATIFMAIMGNIILLPISITLGLVNYVLINYLKMR